MKLLTILSQTRSQLMMLSLRMRTMMMKQKRKSLSHKVQKALRRIITRMRRNRMARRSYHNQPKYIHSHLSNLQLKMEVNTLKIMVRPINHHKMLNQ